MGKDPSEPRADSKNNQSSNEQATVKDSAAGIVIRKYAPADKKAAERAEERERQNLDLQRRMAEASENSNFLNKWQVGLVEGGDLGVTGPTQMNYTDFGGIWLETIRAVIRKEKRVIVYGYSFYNDIFSNVRRKTTVVVELGLLMPEAQIENPAAYDDLFNYFVVGEDNSMT
jgi:hypothetical protein